MFIVVYELECYFLGMQVFVLMNGEVFVVIIVFGDDKFDFFMLWVFISNGWQGVNYYCNVWYYLLFVWQMVIDFLMVDCGGSDNCDVESILIYEFCFV